MNISGIAIRQTNWVGVLEQVQNPDPSLEGTPESTQGQIQNSDHSLAETSVTANDRSQPERLVEQVAANPVLNPKRRVPE